MKQKSRAPNCSETEKINFNVLFMFLDLFTYMLVSTRFPCQMMFGLLNTTTTGVTSGAGTTKPSGVSELTPVFVRFVLFDLLFSRLVL
jgi:hypothetical protein